MSKMHWRCYLWMQQTDADKHEGGQYEYLETQTTDLMPHHLALDAPSGTSVKKSRQTCSHRFSRSNERKGTGSAYRAACPMTTGKADNRTRGRNQPRERSQRTINQVASHRMRLSSLLPSSVCLKKLPKWGTGVAFFAGRASRKKEEIS
jgi:hypothetical protein